MMGAATSTRRTGSHFLYTATTNTQGTARLDETLTLTLILLNAGYNATFEEKWV
ncbi:hypothetical protein [Streptomyces inhibens]|uniref:hypothetical protein n=1 Tax=Streptomyces inhibens TaxID=2293571 RepID=UPI001EE73DFB|nr:hypothetical protein [Streptomyces inhibens]UKY48053.1 hypothetical protein KI385_03990 [Streptomyces inhibens]